MVRNLTAKDVRTFCNQASWREDQSKEVSGRTVERRMTEVQAMVRWATREHRLPSPSALAATKPRVYSSAPRYLSKDEYRTLTDVVHRDGPEWLAWAIRLAVSTGLRRSSLVDLRWKHIDPVNGWITVHPEIAKSSGYRVPIFDETAWVLEEIGPGPGPAPVLTHSRGAVDKYYLTHQFADARKRAGLSEDIHLHTCRHTFASWLVQEGVSIYTVSKWMGHSSVTVTERYAHLAPDPDVNVGGGVFGASDRNDSTGRASKD
jgi:integrase